MIILEPKMMIRYQGPGKWLPASLDQLTVFNDYRRAQDDDPASRPGKWLPASALLKIMQILII
jgi:hypothetical protein